MTSIRIATRSSQLALWQAEEVKRLLLAVDSSLSIDLVPIKSDGDVSGEQGFAHFGYKGIFTKRIEEALLDGSADIAVHSMKDMHSELPDSLTIGAVLEREDPRDAFISTKYDSLAALPEGATFGTASVRRAAMLKQLRPDLKIVPFRGNVPTRLEKLQKGEVDATLLAVAGLKRLGMDQHITEILEPEVMLPAVCQGVIGVECRRDDTSIMELLAHLTHLETMHAVNAERALLAALDGDCKTPVGGYAEVEEDMITLVGEWAGDAVESVQESGHVSDAVEIGHSVGMQLKNLMHRS